MKIWQRLCCKLGLHKPVDTLECEYTIGQKEVIPPEETKELGVVLPPNVTVVKHHVPLKIKRTVTCYHCQKTL